MTRFSLSLSLSLSLSALPLKCFFVVFLFVLMSRFPKFPVYPTYCTDPHLAQSIRYIMLLEEQIRWSLMKNVFLVLTLLKMVVCCRCSLQMMHFFRTLKASLCFLVLFWLMWLLCRGFGRHQRLSQVVAIPFKHDRWRWYCLSHS